MKKIDPAAILALGVLAAALTGGALNAAVIVPVEAESVVMDTNVWRAFTAAQFAAGGQNDGGNPISYDGSGLSGSGVQHIADQNGDAGPGNGNLQLTFDIPSAGTYYLYTRLVVPTDSGIRSNPTAEPTSGSFNAPNNDSYYLPVLADVPISGTGGTPVNGRNTGDWGATVTATTGIPGFPLNEPAWVIAVHQDDVTTPIGTGVFKSRMSGGLAPQTYSLSAGSHTLHIRGREVGLIVDAFVLADTSNLTASRLNAVIGIPEPATFSLAALALGTLLAARRRGGPVC